jgi:hypothetical protein
VTAAALRFAVVVLSWNGRDDTLACLASLERLERPDVALICVDNASHDGSADAVRASFPAVALLEAGANLGFAGGSNLGIRHAVERGADWVVLLNNDATVAPDSIDAFAAAARLHPRAGILAGTVLFADRPDRIWFAGQRVSTLTGYSGRPRGYGRLDGPAYAAITPTDRAVGAFMAVSRPALDAAGLLDEDLFAYVEDVDLSLRVRRAGFEVLVVPRARAWHRVSASTGGETGSTHAMYYGVRNTVVVTERHRPLQRPLRGLRRALIVGTFALHVLRGGRRAERLRAVGDGFRDARAGRLGERPTRRRPRP